MRQKFKKQHRNSESNGKESWKVDRRVPGLHFVTPRKVVDKNVVLKFWPRLYIERGLKREDLDSEKDTNSLHRNKKKE